VRERRRSRKDEEKQLFLCARNGRGTQSRDTKNTAKLAPFFVSDGRGREEMQRRNTKNTAELAVSFVLGMTEGCFCSVRIRSLRHHTISLMPKCDQQREIGLAISTTRRLSYIIHI
jgi:hypothetical protein